MARQLFFRKPFRYSFFNATLILILLNFAAFAFCSLNRTYNWTAMLSLNVICVNHYHMFWQFFTYMFMHGSFSHIFFNMLGLLMFGITLERAIGSKEFLLFYLFCGLMDGIISILVYANTGRYMVWQFYWFPNFVPGDFHHGVRISVYTFLHHKPGI